MHTETEKPILSFFACTLPHRIWDGLLVTEERILSFFFFKFQNLYEQRQGFPRTNGVKTKQEEFFAGENHFDYYMGPPSSLFGMIVNSLEFISNLYLYTNFRLVGRAESLHQNPINPILQFWIFFLFVSSVMKLLVS